jgi:hypothetical protein
MSLHVLKHPPKCRYYVSGGACSLRPGRFWGLLKAKCEEGCCLYDGDGITSRASDEMDAVMQDLKEAIQRRKTEKQLSDLNERLETYDKALDEMNEYRRRNFFRVRMWD